MFLWKLRICKFQFIMGVMHAWCPWTCEMILGLRGSLSWNNFKIDNFYEGSQYLWCTAPLNIYFLILQRGFILVKILILIYWHQSKSIKVHIQISALICGHHRVREEWIINFEKVWNKVWKLLTKRLWGLFIQVLLAYKKNSLTLKGAWSTNYQQVKTVSFSYQLNIFFGKRIFLTLPEPSWK